MNTLARIATINQAGKGFPTIERNNEHVFGLVDVGLSHKPDLICLPERFDSVGVDFEFSHQIAEPLDGPTIAIAAARAARQLLHHLLDH